MKKNILSIIIFIIFTMTFIFDFFFRNISNYYLEALINIIYIASIILLIYIENINQDKEKKKKVFKYIFIFYIILIIYLTFNRTWHYREGMYNLIPFKTILNLRNDTSLFKTLIFNFFLYMPLAIILPNMSDKLKSTKNYIITIIFISICLKGTGYILHYSILDIDDILLNITGAYLIFIILKKKQVNQIIQHMLFDIKMKEKLQYILYITIYLIFIGIAIIKSCNGIGMIYSTYYRDFSHFICYKKEKTYITTIRNEKYYSKCNYQNSYIIAGDIKYSIPDYVNSPKYREKDNFKLYIIKEKILDNVKIIKKENSIKKISNANPMRKMYLVDIDYISLTKNNINYIIKDDNRNDINFYNLVKPVYSEIKYFQEYWYVLYTGEYFNIINVFKTNENPWYEFIVPKDYKIIESKIINLYELAKDSQ